MQQASPRVGPDAEGIATVQVGGPWFEQLRVGLRSDAPPITVTSAHAALHQAIVGERFRLALDSPMCLAVTGADQLLVSPSLVCNIAIGQSTWFSQRVRANLFYRRLVILRPVHVGDTLTTTTEVVALKQNRPQAGKLVTGLAVLRVTTVNQRDERVLDFWRCPMLPLRDATTQTGHADDIDAVGMEIDGAAVMAAVPDHWRLDIWQRAAPAHPAAGVSYQLEGADVVSSAPELARMTLNLAAAHFDPAASPYGRRLVFGGHTIAVAAAQLTRMLPGIATILAWQRCDHIGPVFEGDLLTSRATVQAIHPARDTASVVEVRVTSVVRDIAAERPVLDWQLFALM